MQMNLLIMTEQLIHEQHLSHEIDVTTSTMIVYLHVAVIVITAHLGQQIFILTVNGTVWMKKSATLPSSCHFFQRQFELDTSSFLCILMSTSTASAMTLLNSH